MVRLVISLFIAVSICSNLYSQSQWEASFVVVHPDGFTDTVWIGLDSLGDIGFQDGLDVIDTIFEPPVAIGSYDPNISAESCVNLREDFRAFQNGSLVFPLYVKSDANFVGSEALKLTWDSLDFDYRSESFYLQEAWMESSNGYLGAIDKTDHFIAGYSVAEDTVSLYNGFTDISGFIGLGECDDLVNHIVQIDIILGFNVFPVGIGELALEAKFYPNPFIDHLFIETPNVIDVRWSLIDLSGKLIDQDLCQSCDRIDFSVKDIDSGLYSLVVEDVQSGQRGAFLLQKN